MKINFMSDLHLEVGHMHLDNVKNADVLVLAGDIGVAKKPSYLQLVKDWAEQYKDVIYVAGNHEFYKGDIDIHTQFLHDEFVGTNVHFLDNDFVYIDDVLFMGGTLWAAMDADPLAAFHANQRMNDFRIIRMDSYRRKFRAEDASDRFYNTKRFFTDALNKVAKEKTVVVTHHAPSFRSVHANYEGDLLNHAYATDMEEFILLHEPNLWIHGHMHHMNDYMIGNTRVVSNPRGYVGYEMNNVFDKTWVIDV